MKPPRFSRTATIRLWSEENNLCIKFWSNACHSLLNFLLAQSRLRIVCCYCRLPSTSKTRGFQLYSGLEIELATSERRFHALESVPSRLLLCVRRRYLVGKWNADLRFACRVSSIVQEPNSHKLEHLIFLPQTQDLSFRGKQFRPIPLHLHHPFVACSE